MRAYVRLVLVFVLQLWCYIICLGLSCEASVPQIIVQSWLRIHTYTSCITLTLYIFKYKSSDVTPYSGDLHGASTTLPDMVLFLLFAEGRSTVTPWRCDWLCPAGLLPGLPTVLHQGCGRGGYAQDQGTFPFLQMVWRRISGVLYTHMYICLNHRGSLWHLTLFCHLSNVVQLWLSLFSLMSSPWWSINSHANFTVSVPPQTT